MLLQAEEMLKAGLDKIKASGEHAGRSAGSEPKMYAVSGMLVCSDPFSLIQLCSVQYCSVCASKSGRAPEPRRGL